MLRIKYIEDFKAGQPYLVVTSNRQGFLKAYKFFKRKPGGFLNDDTVTEYSDIGSLDIASLSMNHDECTAIAERFRNVISDGKPRHSYFDIQALPNTEIIISYKEYDELF